MTALRSIRDMLADLYAALRSVRFATRRYACPDCGERIDDESAPGHIKREHAETGLAAHLDWLRQLREDTP